MSPVSQHEFSRIGLLATLSGEKLNRLAERMERERLEPGRTLETGDRFYVVLSGMLTTGAGRLLRGGDHLFETTARAVTPSVVASCDAATFEELVRPLLG